MKAWKNALPIFVLVLGISMIALGTKLANDSGGASIFSALAGGDSHKNGDFYITPSEQSADQTQRSTFMSYIQNSTNPVPTKADWTVEEDTSTGFVTPEFIPVAYASLPAESAAFLDKYSDKIQKLYVSGGTAAIDDATVTAAETAVEQAEESSSIILKNCENSEACQVTVGNRPGKYKITAKTSAGKTTTAKLTINKKMKSNPFTDNVPDWATEGAYVLQANNIMKGYADGKFGAGDSVTRAQLSVLIYRILIEYQNLDATTAVKDKKCGMYADVRADHYASDAVCYGYYANWFTNSNNLLKFNPDQGLTRKEVAQILYNALGKKIIQSEDGPFTKVSAAQLKLLAGVFSDVPKTDSSTEAIGASYLLMIMTGTTDDKDVTTLSPERVVTRGEIATILWRTLQKVQMYLPTADLKPAAPEVDNSKPTI